MAKTGRDKISPASEQTGTPPEDEGDVEGHSLLTMSDAFVKSRMPNQGELEREARRQAELKQARANRKGS